MKSILKSLFTLLLILSSYTSHANILDIKVYNEIAYILDLSSQQLRRYSFEQEQFLSPILESSNNIIAMDINESGIYIGDGNYIHRYAFDSNEGELIYTRTNNYFNNFNVIDDYLILSIYNKLISIKISTGEIVDQLRIDTGHNKLYLDHQERKVYAVAKAWSALYENTKDRVHTVKVNDEGLLVAQGEVSNNNVGHMSTSFFMSPEVDYFFDGRGKIFDKGNLNVVAQLQDYKEGDYVNHGFSDAVFWKGLTLTLSSETVINHPVYTKYKKLNLFDEAHVKVYSALLDINYKKTHMKLRGDKLYFFSPDSSDNVEVLNVEDIFTESPSIPVDPTNLNFFPNYVEVDKGADTIYMFALGQQAIFRWSVAESRYLDSISLSQIPNTVVYSKQHDRIYLGYGNQIHFINLSTLQESYFATLQGDIQQLKSAGNYIAADSKNNTNWNELSIFNKNADKTDSKNIPQYQVGISFNEKLDRLYIFHRALPEWFTLEESTGALIGGAYVQSADYRSLPAVPSIDGTKIVTVDGKILDGYDFIENGTFGEADTKKHDFLAWHQGNIFSFSQWDSELDKSSLTRYQADFSTDYSGTYEVDGIPIALLPIRGKDDVVVIALYKGFPQIYILPFEVKDFDNDGVTDDDDEFPTNPNLTKFLASSFLPLTSGSEWRYSNGINATVGKSMSINDRNIKPLEFSSGSKIYFDTLNDKLTFHGFYLPKINIAGTDYTVDMLLASELGLMKNQELTGSGTVNISPTYGDKAFTFNAKINFIGESLVDQKYDAVAVELDINANIIIDGAQISLDYKATYYFAPEIGLVRIDEGNGNSSILDKYSKPKQSSNDNNPAKNTDASGGGVLFQMLLLLLIVIFYRGVVLHKINSFCGYISLNSSDN